MPHDTDPTPVPPDPTGHGPHDPNAPPPGGEQPAEPMELPDVPEIDFSDLPDIEAEPAAELPPAEAEPGLPIAEAEEVTADAGGVSFDLPDFDDDHGNRTVGVSREDLEGIPGLSGLFAKQEATAEEPVVPAVPSADWMMTPEPGPAAEAVPAAEVPHEPLHVEPVVFSPADEVAEVVPPVEEVDDAAILDLAEPLPGAEDVPMAEAASGSGLLAFAEPAEQPPAPESAVAFTEPVVPIEPASGWLVEEPAAPVGEAGTVGPIDSGAGLLDAEPVVESSDIFAGGPVPTAFDIDQSDVIAATAYSPPPLLSAEPSAAPVNPSDVALSFDSPPGGSTVKDPNASIDLPVAAEEVVEAEVVPDAEPIDSARLADAPVLPPDHGEADLGTPTDHLHPDASSILSELIDPRPGMMDDSSAIRLEAPGVGRTLTDEPMGAEFGDPGGHTVPDGELTFKPPLEGTAEQPVFEEVAEGPDSGPTDWREQVGSDLFSDGPTMAEIDLGGSGRLDPFPGESPAEQESPSSGQSSIFSGTRPETPLSPGESGEVPVGTSEMDAVDFSDHPDPRGADSDSLHRPFAEVPGADEFEVVPDDAGEVVDAVVDWNAVADDDAPPAGPLSSIRLADDSGFTNEPAPTDVSAPVDDLLAAAGLAPPPAAGKPRSKPEVTPPPAVPDVSDSVVVDWVAESSEKHTPLSALDLSRAEEEKKAEPRAPRRAARDDSDETRTIRAKTKAEAPRGGSGAGRTFAGGLVGLLVGVGACAGLYVAGVVPNSTENKPAAQTPGPQAGATDPEAAAALAAAEKRATEAKAAADTAEKERDAARMAAADLKTQLTEAQAQAQKAATTLTAAETRAAAVADKLKTADVDREKVQKALDTEKEMVTTLAKDLKAAQALALDLQTKAKKADEALTVAEKAKADADATRLAAEKARDDATASLTAVAKELQAAKLLPEKYDAATLLAAIKEAGNRATGPSLTTLLPPGVAAAVGTPLTTGQLLDVATRLNKAESEVAKLTDRLKTETTKLKADQAAELKALKDAAAEDMKKLAEKHKTELAKATDAATTAVEAMKKEQAAELKKLSDKFAADRQKLELAQAEKVKDLEARIAAEKANLGNAFSPVEAVDVWLPLVAELRRPTDAEPALAAANKVLKTAAPGSEEEARAATLAGLAYLLKNDPNRARSYFTRAKQSPAFAPGSEWARAVETGLETVEDPVAGFRRKVEPRLDPALAARMLDAGIRDYRAGRYADAAGALAEAVKNNPDDPLGWYFLGAARWQQGNTKQAQDAFVQGAERERHRAVSARVVTAALTPIQGPARDAINRVRP